MCEHGSVDVCPKHQSISYKEWEHQSINYKIQGDKAEYEKGFCHEHKREDIQQHEIRKNHFETRKSNTKKIDATK